MSYAKDAIKGLADIDLMEEVMGNPLTHYVSTLIQPIGLPKDAQPERRLAFDSLQRYKKFRAETSYEQAKAYYQLTERCLDRIRFSIFHYDIVTETIGNIVPAMVESFQSAASSYRHNGDDCFEIACTLRPEEDAIEAVQNSQRRAAHDIKKVQKDLYSLRQSDILLSGHDPDYYRYTWGEHNEDADPYEKFGLHNLNLGQAFQDAAWISASQLENTRGYIELINTSLIPQKFSQQSLLEQEKATLIKEARQAAEEIGFMIKSARTCYTNARHLLTS